MAKRKTVDVVVRLRVDPEMLKRQMARKVDSGVRSILVKVRDAVQNMEEYQKLVRLDIDALTDEQYEAILSAFRDQFGNDDDKVFYGQWELFAKREVEE